MRSYGISVPTLEDVFLRVTNEKNKSIKPGSENSELSQEEENEEIHPSNDIEQNNEPLTELDRMAMDFTIADEVEKETGWSCGTYFEHLGALFIKRLHIMSRNYKGLMVEIFIPALLILIGFGFSKI